MTRASSDRFRERIQGDGATRLPDPVIRDCVVEVERQASPCLASRRWCFHHGRGGDGGYVCGGTFFSDGDVASTAPRQAEESRLSITAESRLRFTVVGRLSFRSRALNASHDG
jgi:hypothetical protein